MPSVQINRSNTASYVPATLNAGELFYNSADDKLYIGNLDLSVTLVTADPADIESRLASLEVEANATTVAVVAPSSPSTGDLWFDSSISQLKVYTGSEWELGNDPYKLTTVAASGLLPITTAELFQHIRFTPDAAETTEGERFINSATIWAEQYTGRYFKLTDLIEYHDDFPAQTNYLQTVKNPFILKGSDAVSVASITYYNNDAVLTTVDASEYRIVNKHSKGHVLPSVGKFWPSDVISGDSDVVMVSYRTGLAPADVPASVKSAILLIAASMFENRENEIVGQGIALLKPIIAAKDLLHPYKVR